MTITPPSALPGMPILAAGEEASGGGPSDGTAGTPCGDFLAAILAALSATTEPPATPPADTSATDGVSTDTAALAAGLASVPPVPVPIAATSQSGATASPAADAGVAAVPPAGADRADEHANVTAGNVVPIADPARNIRMPVAIAPAAGPTEDLAGGAATATAVAAPVAPTGPGTPGSPPSGAAPSTGPATSTRPAEHANVTGEADLLPADPTSDIRMPDDAPTDPTPTSSRHPEPSAVPDQVTGTTRVDATAPTSPTSTDGADRVRSVGVPTQVFPEVAKLVSRGDGVHRVTMTLTPESLGEVRVVMTMRDGVVRVHLTASDGDAKAALAHGSPELARLLHLVGASDARIVVRDLPPGPAPMDGQTPQLAAGGDRHQHAHEHAGTRAQHPATDGTNDTTPLTGAGTDLSRSIEPVAATRTSGVDVTV